MGTVITLKRVRLSFPRLDIPDYYQGIKQRSNDKKRWSASFHVNMDDAQKKMVDDTIAAEAKAKWGAKAAANLKGILTDPKGCCWMDGDLKGHEGVMILSTHRYEDQGPPKVIDNDLSPIYDQASRNVIQGKEGRLFAGCYVNAQVEFWIQDNKAGKGVRCGLLVIQRIAKGEPFGGGSAADMDEFEEIEEGADAEDLS